MQSKEDILYQNLFKNLKRINASMRDLDMESLPDLLDEHDQIIKDIKSSKIDLSQKMKDLIKRSLNQLESIITETEKMQLKIAGQLKTIGNKQKLNSVYSDKEDYK